MEWVNAVVQGILVGGLYALFAAGLSLIFGVMRLVNIAHGDLIVLAAYIALVTTQALGINPLLSLVIVVPVMAAIGYGLQRALLNRTHGDDLLPPLLVTFGLSVIIQNGLLELFTADSVKLNAGAVEIESIAVGGGLAIGVLPLIQFGLAIAVIAGLQWLFYRTALGRAFRAIREDELAADAMGIPPTRYKVLAFVIGAVLAGVVGAMSAPFDLDVPVFRRVAAIARDMRLEDDWRVPATTAADFGSRPASLLRVFLSSSCAGPASRRRNCLSRSQAFRRRSPVRLICMSIAARKRRFSPSPPEPASNARCTRTSALAAILGAKSTFRYRRWIRCLRAMRSTPA